jgi:Rrf2 family protein
MKLSSRARHGVRLALEVARRSGDDQPVQLSEVSRVTGLSKKFLEQLAMALKTHSILRGISGRKGGYLLSRPAGDITIGQVLTAVIGPIDLTDCIEQPKLCISAEFCECRLVWLLLRERINKVLDEYTLADLTDKDWLRAIQQELSDLDPLTSKANYAAHG